jgi:hypothetical protein
LQKWQGRTQGGYVRRLKSLHMNAYLETTMTRTIPCLLALLLPPQAEAQATRDDTPITAGTAADLYRRAAEPKTPPLRVVRRDPAREWKDNMVNRIREERRDDDACLLSFSLGGDLEIRGYKGVRLFGTTRTLSRPPTGEGR